MEERIWVCPCSCQSLQQITSSINGAKSWRMPSVVITQPMRSEDATVRAVSWCHEKTFLTLHVFLSSLGQELHPFSPVTKLMFNTVVLTLFSSLIFHSSIYQTDKMAFSKCKTSQVSVKGISSLWEMGEKAHVPVCTDGMAQLVKNQWVFLLLHRAALWLKIKGCWCHGTSWTCHCADVMPGCEARVSAGTGRSGGDLPGGLFTFYLLWQALCHARAVLWGTYCNERSLATVSSVQSKPGGWLNDPTDLCRVWRRWLQELPFPLEMQSKGRTQGSGTAWVLREPKGKLCGYEINVVTTFVRSQGWEGRGHIWGSLNPCCTFPEPVLRISAPKGAFRRAEPVLWSVLCCLAHMVQKRACLQLLQPSETVGTFICYCRKESQYFMNKAFYHRTLVNISII